MDETVVKSIRQGNKEVFKTVFETYYNPLLRFAFRYVRTEAVAEELVQDLFLWIWENRERWNVEGNLKTYLFRAVKYKAMDYWRQQRTRKQYAQQYADQFEPHSNPQLPDEPTENDFVKEVQQAIDELPERPRMVYKMNRLEGLTYREIAEVLEVSPKTVETHMSRALNFLRKRFANYLQVMAAIGFISNIVR